LAILWIAQIRRMNFPGELLPKGRLTVKSRIESLNYRKKPDILLQIMLRGVVGQALKVNPGLLNQLKGSSSVKNRPVNFAVRAHSLD
jgi:hypothetical protein